MGLLRLLLAMAVVIGHSTPIFGLTLTGSMIAVQSFFILSGFYMSLILNEKYIKQNNSYSLFISNRLLKLYPPYWLIILCILIFCCMQYYISKVVYVYGNDYGALSGFFGFYQDMNWVTRVYLFFVNIFIFGQDTLQFLGLNLTTGSLYFTPTFATTYPQLHFFLLIPVTWAVSLELYFYLIAPFIVRRKLLFVGFIILMSLALRWYLSSKGLTYDPWNYRFFPTELAFFLFGYISYKIYKYIQPRVMSTVNLWFIYIVFLVFTIFYTVSPFSKNTVIYLAVLVLFIPFIFILSKNWKFDRYLGELSYLIFISHIFVLSVIMYFKIPFIQDNGGIVFIASFLFSVIIHEIFLKNLERIRQHRVTKTSIS